MIGKEYGQPRRLMSAVYDTIVNLEINDFGVYLLYYLGRFRRAWFGLGVFYGKPYIINEFTIF